MEHNGQFQCHWTLIAIGTAARAESASSAMDIVLLGCWRPNKYTAARSVRGICLLEFRAQVRATALGHLKNLVRKPFVGAFRKREKNSDFY